MELKTLTAFRGVNPFSRRFDELILSVATPYFEGALFSAAQEATGCNQLTAYSAGPTSERQMIIAATTGEERFARETGLNYVARFWEADPVNLIGAQICEADGILFVRPSIDELRHASFRRRCHSAAGWIASGVHMIDRVSIFRRHGNRTVKISFHRREESGRFGEREIGYIIESADLLLTLMHRHAPGDQTTLFDVRHPARESYLRKLRATVPALSPREAEVCACIVHGMSSEGIAGELGISVNTVRTFRKRAYSRLNISSQNELIKTVLRDAPQPFSNLGGYLAN